MGTLHPEAWKAAGTHLQLRAVTDAVPSKVTGAELPKTVGAYLLYQCALGMGHDAKEDCFEALIFNDCSAWFQICMRPSVLLGWFLPFKMEMYAQWLYHHCILEVHNLFLISQVYKWKELITKWNYGLGTFELVLEKVKTSRKLLRKYDCYLQREKDMKFGGWGVGSGKMICFGYLWPANLMSKCNLQC